MTEESADASARRERASSPDTDAGSPWGRRIRTVLAWAGTVSIVAGTALALAATIGLFGGGSGRIDELPGSAKALRVLLGSLLVALGWIAFVRGRPIGATPESQMRPGTKIPATAALLAVTAGVMTYLEFSGTPVPLPAEPEQRQASLDWSGLCLVAVGGLLLAVSGRRSAGARADGESGHEANEELPSHGAAWFGAAALTAGVVTVGVADFVADAQPGAAGAAGWLLWALLALLALSWRVRPLRPAGAHQPETVPTSVERGLAACVAAIAIALCHHGDPFSYYWWTDPATTLDGGPGYLSVARFLGLASIAAGALLAVMLGRPEARRRPRVALSGVVAAVLVLAAPLALTGLDGAQRPRPHPHRRTRRPVRRKGRRPGSCPPDRGHRPVPRPLRGRRRPAGVRRGRRRSTSSTGRREP